MDLYFDVNSRDVLIASGDLELVENASVQNGSILKEARVFDPLNPIWGIGLSDIINAPVDKTNYEMNRWSDQAKKDGAKVAKFTVMNSNRVTDIEIQIEYVQS